MKRVFGINKPDHKGNITKNRAKACLFGLVLYILCILLMLCSCEKKARPELAPESYLTGWYIDDGNVYIVCHMFVMSEKQTFISMEAYSSEDEGKLLKTGRLTGYNEDMSSTLFELHRGRNDFIAVFVGVYGTSDEKYDYLVPDDIKITEVRQ